jgi:hypothetical protein
MSDPSGLCGARIDGVCAKDWQYDPYAAAKASVLGGTKASSKAHAGRQEARNRNPSYRYVRPTNDAERAIARDARKLTAMRLANPDPKFWEAISNYGALYLSIIALKQINESEEFWTNLASAVAAAGGYDRFVLKEKLRVVNEARRIARWETFSAAIPSTAWSAETRDKWRGWNEFLRGDGVGAMTEFRDLTKDVSRNASFVALATVGWAQPVSTVAGGVSATTSWMGTAGECFDGGKGQNCFISMGGSAVDSLTLGYGRAAKSTSHRVTSFIVDALWISVTNAPDTSGNDEPRVCPHYTPGPEMGGGSRGC